MKGFSQKPFVCFFCLLILIFVSSTCGHLLADERFIDNGDGTVTDKKLHLMWSQQDNGGDINWENAYRWVNYNFYYILPGNRHDDWRVPSIDELKSLYATEEGYSVESACGMRIKVIPQISLSCGWIWSMENKGISARVFSFRAGIDFSDLKMNKKAHRVLAVRDIAH